MEAGAHGLSRFHGTTSHPIPLTGRIPLLLPRIRGIFQVQGLIRWIVIPGGGSAGLQASLSLKYRSAWTAAVPPASSGWGKAALWSCRISSMDI
jgi:hypothetical protein